ncbi:MAG TPA: DinB family protein [Chitinophagaceae bacterium]|nr:DinB family protein [Chitinophagaceae bacterium]
MKFILMASLCLLLTITVSSQKLWTETDRKYLVDNLQRTRDALTKETENLTEAQWNFKESPNRWSIKQVVEHIDMWELLLMHEVSKALFAGPQLELAKTAKPDSIYVGFILEEKPHVSTESTKPFTYTLPMGLNDGKTNVAWFLKMREESIAYLKTATEDLRTYYLKPGRPNIHQVYITIFGHTERHLRQVRKIKANSNYPKS